MYRQLQKLLPALKTVCQDKSCHRFELRARRAGERMWLSTEFVVVVLERMSVDTAKGQITPGPSQMRRCGDVRPLNVCDICRGRLSYDLAQMHVYWCRQ